MGHEEVTGLAAPCTLRVCYLGGGHVVVWRRRARTVTPVSCNWQSPRQLWYVMRGAVVLGLEAAVRCVRTRHDLTPDCASVLQRSPLQLTTVTLCLP